jgi:hypothetical protein
MLPDEHSSLTLHALQLDMENAKNNLNLAKEETKKLHRLLSKAEDTVVEASEGLRKAQEALDTYQNTKVVSVVDEDLRDIDLERLRGDLPRLMKLIENEKPIIMQRDLEIEEPEEEEIGADEFDD